ncbi:hypothetical protein N5K55_03015 (plasmid) [Pseudomonas aeruginosa]|nr:hypothetical protein [Pseudomonas aeruginosa]
MTGFTSGFNTTNLKVLRGLINSALANLHPEFSIEAGKNHLRPAGDLHDQGRGHGQGRKVQSPN